MNKVINGLPAIVITKRNILKKVHRKIAFTGDTRTIRAKKNVVCSIVLRGIDIIIGLLLVPLSLKYLDTERYGIWLTIESMVGWFIILDIGLGNGLRNKFAEAYAQLDIKKAKIFISTAYILICCISIVFIGSIMILDRYVNWSSIFNSSSNMNQENRALVLVVAIAFSMRLVLNLINKLWMAMQFPVVQYFVNAISKIITLGILILMILKGNGGLVRFSIAYVLPPLILLLILTIVTFNTKFKEYKPSIRYFDFSCAQPLIGMGVKFFIIQVGYIILMMTDNIIIAQLYGPESVAPYQVAHKYFGTISAFFMILISPLWSATTEAYTNKDFAWIKNTVGKYNKIWILFIMITGTVFVISPIVYDIWIGQKVVVTSFLSFVWAVLVVMQIGNLIYTQVLNGIGILNIQIIGSIFTIILNIPLSIYFAKYIKLGPPGVALATTISFLFYFFTRFIQYKKIINKTASGIWAK